MDLFVVGFFGCIIIIMAILLCVVLVQILVRIGQLILACYECCFPQHNNRPNIWHVGCCCFDVFINCSRESCCSLFTRYEPRNYLVLTTLFFVLRDKLSHHCCSQWGCMARYFGCRSCRKNLKKIVPIKKHYTDNHIIVIDPYDNNCKIGTVSATLNVV
tara:strand:+ start:24 stop:500 length:477 start_codon:yes stop_codon:yes gene_type:complete